MILVIRLDDHGFVVEPKPVIGSPPVGRGKTMLSALGDWLHHNRNAVGVVLEIDSTAVEAEAARRKRELAKR